MHSNDRPGSPRLKPNRRSPKPAPSRKSKASATSSNPAEVEEPPAQPAVGTLARTKKLILAAVRVWELKRRIIQE